MARYGPIRTRSRRAATVVLLLVAYLFVTPLAGKATGPGTWLAISGGRYHTCGIATDGSAWCWGYNSNGQLGDGTNTLSNIPVRVSTAGSLPDTYAEISSGAYFTCGLTAAGTAWCWGDDGNGQLGNGGANVNSNIPQQVDTSGAFPDTYTSISAGWYHACGVASAGAAWCWGRDAEGQLGDGLFPNSAVPSPVDTDEALPDTYASVSAGGVHTCALTAGGAAWCWGLNDDGQLGSGDFALSRSPTAVDPTDALPDTYASISAGYAHTCAIAPGGVLWCWGSNASGQLGDGGAHTATDIPVQVDSTEPLPSTYVGVSSAHYHTCALAADSTAWCWGNDQFDQLGDSSFVSNDVYSPVSVSDAFDIPDTFATLERGGSLHTCAIALDGTAWCWGYGNLGQLGYGMDGVGSSSDWPVQVAGGVPGGATCEEPTQTSDCHVISYSILSFRAISLSDTSPVAFGNVRQGHSATLAGPDLRYGTTWSGDQIYATISPESLDGISLLLDVTDVSPPDSGGCATALGSEGTAMPFTHELSSTESYLITDITDCGAGSGSAETDAHASIALTVDATGANLNADYSVPVTTTVTYTIDAGV